METAVLPIDSRVKLSSRGRQVFSRVDPDRCGTIKGTPSQNSRMVLWDGLRVRSRMSITYLETEKAQEEQTMAWQRDDHACLTCGHVHRILGTPLSAITQREAEKLSRIFNAAVRLDNQEDIHINAWLKILIENTH